MSPRAYRAGVAAVTVGVAAFLGAKLGGWPTHEDEVVAAFVSSRPLDEMLHTVLTERGGAPLHFLLAHAVGAGDPGVLALRAISLACAVACVPVLAWLVARLTDRRTSLLATVLASTTWMVLYHGLYGRMYSLFLLMCLLSFHALLSAVARPTARRWAVWVIASVVAVAVHPYGALVLAVEAAFVGTLVLGRKASWRGPALAFLVVGALGIPFWRATLVLADRFDVGVGGGGKFTGPIDVLRYLLDVLADMSVGWTPALAAVSALLLLGLATLVRERPEAAVLSFAAIAVPGAALLVTRLGLTTFPATRHLIFALPFVALLVATGAIRAAGLARAHAGPALALGTATLVAGQLAWGWSQTPDLYRGESPARAAARADAETWLARNLAPDDVVLGYDPLLLGARERGGPTDPIVVPRADPKLALTTLLDARLPLGRGVWVLDASDPANRFRRLRIPDASPGADFETARFGPFLIVRTREPTETPERFLRATGRVQALGIRLRLTDSVLNYVVARTSFYRLVRLRSAGR
jgi:mannosyltransferase